MILLRTNLARYYHFVKPSLSSLTSLSDLENIMQERLLKSVKQINIDALRQTTLAQQVKHKLLLDQKSAKQVSQRTVQVSVYDANSHEHKYVDVRLDKGLKGVQLQAEEFNFPFHNDMSSMQHFSRKRGVPLFEQLQEYALDQKTLLIFNLPENISEQDIQVMLRQQADSITFKYCVLGLPAYAKVVFKEAETLERSKQRIKAKHIDFGERSSQIRYLQDQELLSLKNRRLVIQLEQDASLSKTIVELSRFGRVLHIDWPVEGSMNPTVEDVKQHYKGTTELIHINKHNRDGTVDSEYYPSIDVWKINEDQRQETNIIQRGERLKQAYQNRCRFARQIDVYEGREYQLNLKNRGYCVVTFSTHEECQNYYFIYGPKQKMELVGQKMQFEYDPLFRKEILRVIDNQHLKGLKNRHQADLQQKSLFRDEIGPPKSVYDQNHYQMNEGRNYESYYLFEQIMTKLYLEQGVSKVDNYQNFREFKEGNQFFEWEERKKQLKAGKKHFQSKTFDQLAEIELYGRVLPKDDRIERLKLETSKYKVSEEALLVNQHNLLTDPYDVMMKNRFYDRQRERNNRITDKALGISHQEEQYEGQDEEQGEEVVQSDEDGDNIGRHGFATFRPQLMYRKRNAEEEATYLRRYGQYVRNTIYEYLGVFEDKLLEEAVSGPLDPLNPRSLSLSNGSPFLCENQLTTALQFRKDFKSAQSDYEDYIYGSQYLKSSGIDLKKAYSNYSEIQASTMQHLTDVGITEQVRKVTGQEEQIRQKVELLNTEIANFGEEYRQEILDNQNYLVKVRRLQSLVPLDRIAHLEQVVQQYEGEITQQQAQVFEKHFKHMSQTGEIPQEVRDTFQIDRELTVAQLMSQVGLEHNITKKDLQMLQRLKSYSKEDLREDMIRQEKIENARESKRKIDSYSFAKDPSEIYVKDREGYFKVSRYRQI